MAFATGSPHDNPFCLIACRARHEHAAAFPPTADPASPHLGIASLVGYRGERGKPATVTDLNIRAFNDLLPAEYLPQCATRMEAWLANAETGQTLALRDAAAHNAYAENVLSAGYLMEHHYGGGVRRGGSIACASVSLVRRRRQEAPGGNPTAAADCSDLQEYWFNKAPRRFAGMWAAQSFGRLGSREAV
jgi:hypothetical protein